MMTTPDSKKLTPEQFKKYSRLIKNKLGIHLGDSKFEMLQGKLSKLAKKAGIYCFDEYYDRIINDKNETWNDFVDEITIHKTNFFREDEHFAFIKTKINEIMDKNPRIIRNKEIRVWSAACSTGQEAYTIAMVLKECLLPVIKIRVLATDISPKAILHAQKGEYALNSEDMINAYYLTKYFEKDLDKYRVINDLKPLITFRTFNLMNTFPFQNTFDIIFCRNVMIYFDDKTQEELVNKFYNVITQGGLLFLGHAESFNHKKHNFKYVEPTIYIKT